jgi:hypothetical protein
MPLSESTIAYVMLASISSILAVCAVVLTLIHECSFNKDNGVYERLPRLSVPHGEHHTSNLVEGNGCGMIDMQDMIARLKAVLCKQLV